MTNTAQTIDWQARAEKAELELERVQKQAAAMREAMHEAASAAGCTWLEQQLMLANVLQTADAGREYVSKEQVRPLVEALRKAEAAIQRHAGINDESRLGWALKATDAALNHARTLGL